jgi:ankyrin repeat protein
MRAEHRPQRSTNIISSKIAKPRPRTVRSKINDGIQSEATSWFSMLKPDQTTFLRDGSEATSPLTKSVQKPRATESVPPVPFFREHEKKEEKGADDDRWAALLRASEIDEDMSVFEFSSEDRAQNVEILCELIASRDNPEIGSFFQHYGARFGNEFCLDSGRTVLGLAINQQIDAAHVRRLLKAGASPCFPDIENSSILITMTQNRAAYWRDIVTSSSECLDHADSNGRTPLWWVIHTFGTQYTYNRAADSDRLIAPFIHQAAIPDQDGVTPLMLAAKLNLSSVILRLLVRLSKDEIDAVDLDGRTALFYATMNKAKVSTSRITSIIRPLIQAGADLEKLDNQGKTAMNYASRNLKVVFTGN